MKLGPCRRCGQSMLWVKTLAGENMPLDPEHDEERGNVVLREVDNRAIVFGSRQELDDYLFVHEGDGPYVSHFATCPKRAERELEGARQETLL